MKIRVFDIKLIQFDFMFIVGVEGMIEVGGFHVFVLT